MHKLLMKRVKYAKKIIREGFNSPFLILDSQETDLGVSVSFWKGKKRVGLNLKKGYYTIYRKVNNRYECLYVGKTDQSIYHRVNRWAKGIAGRLRPDENHAAATRARLDGVRLTDQLYIKYVDQDAVNRIIDDASIRCEPLDEWIAPLLKSKYNRRTFNVGLEPFFK